MNIKLQDLLNTKSDSFEGARQDALSILENRKPNYSLHQRFYNDPLMFQIDVEEIFQKEWLFAGMSSEIPKKGDYFTINIAQNQVLIVRTADGSINAFHNSCRHRGSRLCKTERGKFANIVCPYHQWTYDLNGNLLFAGNEMGEDFDKSLHGLKKVHCRVGGGFIFICLAETAPNDGFEETLSMLDEYMEPYDVENTKLAVESNILEKANWKLVVENNRECYHCNGSHPELLGSLLEWDDTEDPRASEEFKAHCKEMQAQWDAENIPHKHQFHGAFHRNRIVRMPLKRGMKVMTKDGEPAVNRLMGRIKNPYMGSMRFLHLPHSWNHIQSDHFIVFRVLPVSAQESLVTTKWFVHKDAQEGVDYDPEKLRYVWDQTNLQDKELAEENQLGINSIGYEPGPYSQTYEYGVVNFVDWYAHMLTQALGK